MSNADLLNRYLSAMCDASLGLQLIFYGLRQSNLPGYRQRLAFILNGNRHQAASLGLACDIHNILEVTQGRFPGCADAAVRSALGPAS